MLHSRGIGGGFRSPIGQEHGSALASRLLLLRGSLARLTRLLAAGGALHHSTPVAGHLLNRNHVGTRSGGFEAARMLDSPKNIPKPSKLGFRIKDLETMIYKCISNHINAMKYWFNMGIQPTKVGFWDHALLRSIQPKKMFFDPWPVAPGSADPWAYSWGCTCHRYSLRCHAPRRSEGRGPAWRRMLSWRPREQGESAAEPSLTRNTETEKGMKKARFSG